MDKAWAVVAADLFIAIAACSLVALEQLTPLLHPEILTYIEQERTKKSGDAGAPTVRKSALLEVLYQKNDNSIFILSSPGVSKKKLHRYSALLATLRRERPHDVRLRLDRRVPAAVYVPLELDLSRLHINLWLSNEPQ